MIEYLNADDDFFIKFVMTFVTFKMLYEARQSPKS